MQPLPDRTAQYSRGNIIDLSEYRQRVLELPPPAGLPPLPRRTRRTSPLLLLSDVLSISGAVAVLALTVMILSGL